jgi:hypothetical protein
VLDLEAEIQKRIKRAQYYLNPLNYPALIRAYQIEIDTLQTAPRNELELKGAFRRLEAKINQTIDPDECEPLYAKREPLEWLLQLIKYGKPRSPEWSKC